jgi:hypothetical protein
MISREWELTGYRWMDTLKQAKEVHMQKPRGSSHLQALQGWDALTVFGWWAQRQGKRWAGGLEVWLKWWSACFASIKPWVSPSPIKSRDQITHSLQNHIKWRLNGWAGDERSQDIVQVIKNEELWVMKMSKALTRNGTPAVTKTNWRESLRH